MNCVLVDWNDPLHYIVSKVIISARTIQIYELCSNRLEIIHLIMVFISLCHLVISDLSPPPTAANMMMPSFLPDHFNLDVYNYT